MMDPIPEIDEQMDGQLEQKAEPQAVETGDENAFLRAAKKGFYLTLPPLQALIIYISAAIIIGAWKQATKSDVYLVAFWAITGFTLLSPVVNIFRPKWWRNTGLYILSLILFWILLDPLVEPASSRSGYGIGEGAIIFILPIILPFFAVPASGVIKALVNAIRGSRRDPDPIIRARMRKIAWAISLSLAAILISQIAGGIFWYYESVLIIFRVMCFACSTGAVILSIMALGDSQSISGFERARKMGILSLILGLGSFLSLLNL